MSIVSVLAALALLQEPAPASPVAPAAEPDPVIALEDVTVEAPRLEEFVREFVTETAAPARGRGLARWQGRICVGLLNLRPALAQPIADRISQVGLDLGLDIGEPGCRANIIIVFTEDGAGLTRQLVERRRRAFYVGVGGVTRNRAALADFVDTDRPVRWWHASMPVDAATGQRAIRLPGDEGPPAISVFAASRLNTQIRDDMRRAMVIVDVDQLGEVNLAQLADYLALVSLAQIDPTADVAAYDTVLNVFDNPAGVAGLTDWDMSYLKALYRAQNTPVLRANHAAQAGIVAGVMARDLAGVEREAGPGAD